MQRSLHLAVSLALGLGLVVSAGNAMGQAADQKRSLKAAKIFYKEPGMIEVDVRAMRGMLMLTGSVATEADLARADEIAKEVRGVKEVRNRIVVRDPEVSTLDDAALMAKIDAKIEADDDLVRAKERGRLEIEIKDRNVTVKGKLQDWAVAQTLVNDIRRIPGVATLNFDKLRY